MVRAAKGEVKAKLTKIRGDLQSLTKDDEHLKKAEHEMTTEKQIEQPTNAFVHDEKFNNVINKQVADKLEEQVQQLTEAFEKDEQVTKIVNKQVDNKIGTISTEPNAIQKMIDVRKIEEASKKQRENNVVVYRVPERGETTYEGRNMKDKE